MNVLMLLLLWLCLPPQPLRAQVDAASVNEREADDAPSSAVPNLRLVESGLYRSGRPGRDSYARLETLGVKTILNLEGNRLASHERQNAASFPDIRVVNIPMSGWREPSFERLDDALQILATAPRPILVHCRHGEDRTGVVIAAYRAAVEKQPADAAVREARSLHCCHLVTEDLFSLLTRYVAYRAGR